LAPGWETRSQFIAREGAVSFYHYDFYAQALSTIERGHAQDTLDVTAMFEAGLIQPPRLRELFEAIEGALHHYPAIDPPSFRRAVDDALRTREGGARISRRTPSTRAASTVAERR
jgi:hypothetical protein